MNYLLAISCCLSIVHYVFPKSYISTDEVIITFVINYRNRCISNNYRFAIWQTLTIVECINECGLRKHCSGLNYRRYSHVCELFLSSVAGDLMKGHCIFVPTSDITVVQSPCADCDFGKVCDPQNGTCSYKECDVISELLDGHMFGNINDIGGKKKFTCNQDASSYGASYAVCLYNGQWSDTRNCSEDSNKCSPNPCHNGGTCENFENEFRCICTAGYEGATCLDALDCYVNNVLDYAGKMNVTKTGYACERWDEHIGEWGIDPQYAPETTLTEAENYCRNPAHNDWEIWCFSSRHNTEWEYCDVKKC